MLEGPEVELMAMAPYGKWVAIRDAHHSFLLRERKGERDYCAFSFFGFYGESSPVLLNYEPAVDYAHSVYFPVVPLFG